MEWFKFYGKDYLSDPKIISLSATRRSCWITLLSYACSSDNGGEVKYVSEELLMTQSGIYPEDDAWETTKGVLKIFVDNGMITIDNGMITITNWRKRQGSSLTGYERVKKWREKKRIDNDDNVSDNGNDNDRIEVEKKRSRKEKIQTPAPSADAVFSTKEYVRSLRDSNQDHVKLVGFYFHRRGIEFDSLATAQVAFKRHVRAAASVVKFSKEKINEAVRKCEAMENIEWTLETVLKVLTK